jgi:hypothetical protein
MLSTYRATKATPKPRVRCCSAACCDVLRGVCLLTSELDGPGLDQNSVNQGIVLVRQYHHRADGCAPSFQISHPTSPLTSPSTSPPSSPPTSPTTCVPTCPPLESQTSLLTNPTTSPPANPHNRCRLALLPVPYITASNSAHVTIYRCTCQSSDQSPTIATDQSLNIATDQSLDIATDQSLDSATYQSSF